MEKLAEQPRLNQNHEPLNQELRIRTDAETWLAETLNGTMHTSFEFSFDGQELYGEDGGSMGEVFNDAVEAAQIIAKENPSLLFELRRRQIEWTEYQDMLDMANGDKPNSMIVVSDFPPELMDAKEDVGGYNASRQQTMLRVITRQEDGSIRIITQSLDKSDRQGLEAIYQAMGEPVEEGELLGQRIYRDLPGSWQDNLANQLTKTYDDSLTGQQGGKWHAGIRMPSLEAVTNTYDFVRQQQDLIDWFTNEKLSDPAAAEKSRFKLAATMSARYERYVSSQDMAKAAAAGRPIAKSELSMQAIVSAFTQSLAKEMHREERKAASKGRTFSGCGSSVSAELSSTEGQTQESGYGNKAVGSDKFGSLKFNCPKGHENTRPRNKLIDKCKTCGTSVKC